MGSPAAPRGCPLTPPGIVAARRCAQTAAIHQSSVVSQLAPTLAAFCAGAAGPSPHARSRDERAWDEPPDARNARRASAWASAHRTLASDENQASTSARSGRDSLLHLWKRSSATVATEFDALRYCRGADGACCRAPHRFFGTKCEGLRPKRPVLDATRTKSPRSSDRSIPGSSTSPESGRSQPRSSSPATPPRFKREAAFARCNGTAPTPASSGKAVRHCLSRGGDRQINNAIHTIAIIRATHQPETRAYLDRRIAEGKTRRHALRALKRHTSRDVFKRLNEMPLTS